MQLEIIEHFCEIVIKSIDEYRRSESILLKYNSSISDTDEFRSASFTALRHGGSAAIYLHHFSDIVASRGTDPLPDFAGNVRSVRDWLKEQSEKLNGNNDVDILGDIADALKHAVLTRSLPRAVEESGQVLSVEMGFGLGGFGEGAFSGAQVWVLGRNGNRPLVSILNNVAKTWGYALNVSI